MNWLRFQCVSKKKMIAASTPSTQRSLQFLGAFYIHTLMLVILIVFSQSKFSTAIRSALEGQEILSTSNGSWLLDS